MGVSRKSGLTAFEERQFFAARKQAHAAGARRARRLYDYAVANWPRLSPQFRHKHNALRRACGAPPIPMPGKDLFQLKEPALQASTDDDAREALAAHLEVLPWIEHPQTIDSIAIRSALDAYCELRKLKTFTRRKYLFIADLLAWHLARPGLTKADRMEKNYVPDLVGFLKQLGVPCGERTIRKALSDPKAMNRLTVKRSDEAGPYDK
jgi:hypothetical protein